ncbi:MAG TPA: class I SAM-dependent methyltransferase [Methanospirillum sp.]|uniref:class I SAM-dependent methyltransferase n=1 Tax=Methanospirillum sp. TaxID=45200 RepID=UPI002BDD5664|nr:class I SAM-dependent methyltransferase [Methanospirillum sp.]HWQ63314.1 class I SAM-dependent methyltransferase [Methanospirillum sp.]
MNFEQKNLSHIPGTSWAEQWTHLKERHIRSIYTNSQNTFWLDPDNIRMYLENIQGDYSKVVDKQLRTINALTGCSVLDIGSGPGTLAVPLAKLGCNVTVIEQAPLMCQALEEYRIQQDAPPIKIISRQWEDVTSEELQGPFDLIISSFSLTMTDIVGTIRMIQRISSGRVYLFWFLTLPSWAEMMQELWPELHGREYYPTPLADCLWNVLYEMGIYANLEVMESAPPVFYESIAQAAKIIAKRFECTEEWQNKIIHEYLIKNVRIAPDGRILVGREHRSAIIWWDNHRL